MTVTLSASNDQTLFWALFTPTTMSTTEFVVQNPATTSRTRRTRSTAEFVGLSGSRSPTLPLFGSVHPHNDRSSQTGDEDYVTFEVETQLFRVPASAFEGSSFIQEKIASARQQQALVEEPVSPTSNGEAHPRSESQPQPEVQSEAPERGLPITTGNKKVKWSKKTRNWVKGVVRRVRKDENGQGLTTGGAGQATEIEVVEEVVMEEDNEEPQARLVVTNQPVRLEDVKADAFDALVKIQCRPSRDNFPDLTDAEWVSVLSLSHTWGLQDTRERAITELSTRISLSPVTKYALAKSCLIEEWFYPAHTTMVLRDSALSCEEAEVLGIDFTLKIAASRERVLRDKLSKPNFSPGELRTFVRTALIAVFGEHNLGLNTFTDKEEVVLFPGVEMTENGRKVTMTSDIAPMSSELLKKGKLLYMTEVPDSGYDIVHGAQVQVFTEDGKEAKAFMNCLVLVPDWHKFNRKAMATQKIERHEMFFNPLAFVFGEKFMVHYEKGDWTWYPARKEDGTIGHVSKYNFMFVDD